MKLHTLLPLCMPALFAVSCSTAPPSGGMTYAQASGPGTVNGAAFGGQFIPAGGNAAKFALYATGKKGVHDNMVVHGLTYRWSSGVTDAIPANYLGKPVLFRNSLADDVTQATLHSPGVLTTNTGRESAVTVNADVSVKTRRGTERGTVALRFDRAAARNDEFRAATTRDGMMDMRRYGIPPSDLDIGANRVGWKP